MCFFLSHSSNLVGWPVIVSLRPSSFVYSKFSSSCEGDVTIIISLGANFHEFHKSLDDSYAELFLKFKCEFKAHKIVYTIAVDPENSSP